MVAPDRSESEKENVSERIDSVGSGPPKAVADLAGHRLAVTSVSWSPDGRYIASTSYDKTVLVWRVDGSNIVDFP